MTAAASLSDFSSHQAERRQKLWSLLGELPAPHVPSARVLNTTETSTFTLEHLELDLNGFEPVPALLLVPHRRRARAPGLLYTHAHGGTYWFVKLHLTGCDRSNCFPRLRFGLVSPVK
jgi:hypothetical protein